LTAAFEEHPDQDPLVTNHSPTVTRLIPKVPADLVARMNEIHAYYGKSWLKRPERKLPDANWEMQLHMREIEYLHGLKHPDLIQ
jgi:hypothetical protein